MAFDAFMVVNVTANKTLQGESSDQWYRKQGGSDILSFSFSPGEAGILDGSETGPTLHIPVTNATGPLASRESKDKAELNKMYQLMQKQLEKNETRQALLARDLNDKVAKLATVTPDSSRKPSKLKITVKKLVDSASSSLLQAYCHAATLKPKTKYEPFEYVTLYFRKAGGTNPLLYLKITLNKVDVTSYRLDYYSGTELPKEDLTLSFETFKVEYKSQSASGVRAGMTGSSIMGWNFEKNKVL